MAEPKWRVAEELGFQHAWTYDHLGWRSQPDRPWFSAVPTLTAAAMVTERIRLGTLVTSPDFRHPVPFARELLTLDDISDGRVTLGIGTSDSDYDATVLGDRPEDQQGRFTEFVHLMDQLLARDSTTWHGEHFAAEQAHSQPGCVQRPRLPFLIAANDAATMDVAARYGTGWLATGSTADTAADWWRDIAEQARAFDEVLESIGRKRSTVDRYVHLDSAPQYSMASVDCFRDAIGKARELGFTDALSHWPRADGIHAGRESVLEEVASDVLPELVV